MTREAIVALVDRVHSAMASRDTAAIASLHAETAVMESLAATGKPFRIPMLRLFTVDAGLIVHARPIYDFTGLLVQIGVLRTKPIREAV